ncbi:MAG: DNA primase [Paludibacteraceae bacterium]|nr:DNA primase [Paludibacteraceae bacterium]
MISNRTIELVRLQVNIRDVVADYAHLQPSGSKAKCCCPIHNEKTPSFHIDPVRNTFHCFGCGASGDAISFIQKKEGLSFPEAVRSLAKKHNIEIQESTRERTPEEQEQDKQREAMLVAYEIVQKYYRSNIHNQDENARQAYEYACDRWGIDLVEEGGIGFAYDDRIGLQDYAKEHSLSLPLLKEMGLVSHSEKSNNDYDFFRGRVMIPIKDRYGRIIGYSGRTMSSDASVPKYLNTSNNILYQKSNSIFGIHQAWPAAAKEGRFYLVEGAPDVLRLQSIGIDNAVAPLGSDWTSQQLDQLKRYATTLCFLPDADRHNISEHYGTGIKKVMLAGRNAMAAGYKVLVREIPLGADGQKNDPDSYCKSSLVFNELPEEDFVIWYAGKRILDAGDAEVSIAIMEDIANVVALCDKEHERNLYIDKLIKLVPGRTTWNKAVKAAVQSKTSAELRSSSEPTNQDLLEKYGFQQINNRYVSLSADGKMTYWSNFVMLPLFHIRDSVNALRIFELTNMYGQKEIIEFKQEDLNSPQKFSQRVESLGNFIWTASAARLMQLKMYLYENTETATRIDQLGWQSAGFYAFGNGIFANSTWYPIDKYGIVRLPEMGNQYLPALSTIYKHDTQLYQFERSFVHREWSTISLRDYVSQLVSVFGDNAKVAFSFLLATLFRDVIVSQTKFFPMLNIFGPKGSGKSELGHSLMSFFICENTPPNIQNSTLPALADAVAQCANALVHLDEFKNTIDLDKREFLKGLWDGTGRNRMNMDKDKKREVTKVNSGIIVTGQEMATADIALFSRFIFLSFPKSEFSLEAKQRFQQLLDIRKRGCTHLTLEILSHRAQFEACFRDAYNRAFDDLRDALLSHPIEDRILRNWVVPLAAFYALHSVLDLPFSYNDLLSIVTSGVINQNRQTKKNNELASYWDIVSFLRGDGQIAYEGDYSVKFESDLKTRDRDTWHFDQPKRILYIKIKQIAELYTLQARRTGEPLLPKNSLEYYLENSPAYLGKKIVRFKDIIRGVVQYENITNADGTSRNIQKSHTEQAYCFDYDKLVEQYDINLIPSDDDEPADEPEPVPVEVPKQTTMFSTEEVPF